MKPLASVPESFSPLLRPSCNAGYSTLTVSALQGKAGNRTTSLLHLLVKNEANEERQWTLRQQTVGVRVLGETEFLRHHCNLRVSITVTATACGVTAPTSPVSRSTSETACALPLPG